MVIEPNDDIDLVGSEFEKMAKAKREKLPADSTQREYKRPGLMERYGYYPVQSPNGI